MSILKNTKGEWEIDGNAIFPKGLSSNIAIVQLRTNIEETEANTKLIAEAGTVTNETGKTPRQLADENKDFLEVLIELDSLINSLGLNLPSEFLIKYEKAITKATK